MEIVINNQLSRYMYTTLSNAFKDDPKPSLNVMKNSIGMMAEIEYLIKENVLSLVSYVCFVDRCLSFCTFSFLLYPKKTKVQYKFKLNKQK